MRTLEGYATTTLNHPRERVWQFIADPVRAVEFMAGIEELTPVELDAEGRVTVADVVGRLLMVPVTFRVGFDYSMPSKVSFGTVGRAISVRKIAGSFSLTDLPNGRTLLRYDIFGDLGPAGSLLLRGPVREQMLRFVLHDRIRELARIAHDELGPDPNRTIA
ncbi:SRPBCC family protein [Nocardia sp. NBC_01388]|uniref:SRPBCC family protein n=1 Tax=Nocardia sp. NBC_01388 TaxID=2903596 RepID=UPI0032535F51